jgi:phenylacetate-CoA ligase
VLDPNGNKISPFAINVKMKDYHNIYQFQFIQEDLNRYQLLLVVNDQFDTERSILEDLYKILGQEANIEISIVDEIKPLPSGKRPYIINKFSV